MKRRVKNQPTRPIIRQQQGFNRRSVSKATLLRLSLAMEYDRIDLGDVRELMGAYLALKAAQ